MNAINKIKEILNDETFIFDFDNLEDWKKDEWLKGYYASYIKPKNDYDENGLRFDIDWLEIIGNNILLIPVKFMAEYVDIITKELVDTNDEGFIQSLKETEMLNYEDMQFCNATSCGNLAYIYMNTKDIDVKNMIKKNIKFMIQYKIDEILEEYMAINN